MAHLITLSPVDLVLRVARATVGASEVPANTNRGPFVDRVLKVTGTPSGNPWCAAFTTMIGVEALGDAWPVRKSASVQQQCDWAAKAKCRLVATKTPAMPGDLFALYYASLKRYAHIGFVVSVAADGKTVETVEGNTSGAGEREGWCVWSKTRVLTPKDRLIRWVDVLKTADAGGA